LFSYAGIRPEDIRDIKDIRKIPLTSKQNIQENYSQMIPVGIDTSKLSSSFTSGSTGIPLKIIYDHSHFNHNKAITRYCLFECGVKPSDNFVTVWGRAQSITKNREYMWLFSGIRETVVPLFPQEKLIKILQHLNPDVLSTFPSVLSGLANYSVSGINPKLIFTQGELVTQHCRDIVRKKFNLEMFDTYGSVEFECLAFECNEHSGLHIIHDSAYIEFVDEQREQVSPGEPGEIIVSGLYNYAMPLIRYRIGDVATPTDEKCSCGRSWPLMKNFQGRMNEFLILPSGRRISWLHFYHHYYKELEKNVAAISQYQIIQDQKNRIIFKVVKGKDFDFNVLERIKNNLVTYFKEQGENMEVVMDIVEEIEKERTGKIRMFIPMESS